MRTRTKFYSNTDSCSNPTKKGIYLLFRGRKLLVMRSNDLETVVIRFGIYCTIELRVAVESQIFVHHNIINNK